MSQTVAEEKIHKIQKNYSGKEEAEIRNEEQERKDEIG